MKNPDQRDTRLRTIDSFKSRIADMKADLKDLREELSKAKSHVKELKLATK
jgi:hypothetical protein